MKLCVILFLLCPFSVICFGQKSTSDSQEILTSEQASLNISSQKIDSVRAFFMHSADSLEHQYYEGLTKIDSAQHRLGLTLSKISSIQAALKKSLPVNRLDSTERKWRDKVDSLTVFNEYSSKVSRVLDSVRASQEKTLAQLNTKIQSLKEKAVDRLDDMNIPPQLSNKVSEASTRINEYQMRSLNLKISDLSTINDLEADWLKELDLPLVQDLNMDKLGELKNIGDLSNVSYATGKFSPHITAAQEVVKGTAGGLDAIENLAESHAAELSGLEGIKDQTEKLNELKNLTRKIENTDSLKDYAIERSKDIAVDHFSGKEEQLTQAMQTLARYKAKYPNLNSISEAARKPPNEMKGKPLIERIVAGISLQARKKGDDCIMDFNPYAGYRFTGRLSAGLGWNQRLAYTLDHKRFNAAAQLFGPRVFGEFKLRRGFSPRAEIEIMNTIIPALMRSHSVDPLHREWVWGVFAGIKKEYKFIGNVRGTASVMMRLYNRDDKSPYADVVNARIGFELPMKKKLSRPDQ